MRVADCPASSDSLTAAHDAVPVTSSQPFANIKSCAIRSAAAAAGWEMSSSSLGSMSAVAEPASSPDAYDAEEQLHSSVDTAQSAEALELRAGTAGRLHAMRCRKLTGLGLILLSTAAASALLHLACLVARC